MALSPCVECSKPISTAASVCPSCGKPEPHAPQPEAIQASRSAVDATVRANDKHALFWFGVALAVVVLVVSAASSRGSRRRDYVAVVQGATDPKPDVEAELTPGELVAREKRKRSTEIQRGIDTAAYTMAIPAREVRAAYRANELVADQRFKDKWVKISGVVDSIGKDLTGGVYVTLRTGSLVGEQIQCFIPEDRVAGMSRFAAGDSVTVMGRGAGKFFNLVFKDCAVSGG